MLVKLVGTLFSSFVYILDQGCLDFGFNHALIPLYLLLF